MEQEVQQQQNQDVVEDNTSNVSQENTEETKVDLSGVEVMSNGKEVDLSEPKAESEDTPAQEEEDKKAEANTAQEGYKDAKTSMEQAKETLTSKGVNYAKLEEEYNENGALSEESYKALKDAGYDKEVVDAVIAGWQAKVDKFVDAVIEQAGGQKEYDRMIKFVQSQGNNAVEAFNNIVVNGDLNLVSSYIAGVKAQMVAKYGTDNPTLTGRGIAKGVKGFADQSEMVKAMSDKRYGRDEKYTKEVEKKIAASTSIFG